MNETEIEINDLNKRVSKLEDALNELLDLLSTDEILPNEVQKIINNIYKTLNKNNASV